MTPTSTLTTFNIKFDNVNFYYGRGYGNILLLRLVMFSFKMPFFPLTTDQHSLRVTVSYWCVCVCVCVCVLFKNVILAFRRS